LLQATGVEYGKEEYSGTVEEDIENWQNNKFLQG
jgi:hypothetical protein